MFDNDHYIVVDLSTVTETPGQRFSFSFQVLTLFSCLGISASLTGQQREKKGSNKEFSRAHLCGKRSDLGADGATWR